VRRANLKVGDCTAVPGRLSYGTFEGVQLPTGGADSLAVVIAQGLSEGPTLWLTANIHGNELAGITALHRLLQPDLCSRMRGTIVAIPSLNPAGLRTNRRHPYWDDRDPNRTFPGCKKGNEDPREPSLYERLAARLLEALRGSADLYIDLHCASIQSVGFSIRDRVLFRDESERPAVESLSARVDEMVAAFGFPGVVEFRSQTYLARELHKSTTGSALQELRIPTFTVELGAHSVVDQATTDACVVGLRNVMHWAGMLAGSPEPMPSMPRPPDGRVRRREDGPYPAATGILDFHVKPGDYLKEGGVVAHISDIWGRPVSGGEVGVPADTWIIGLEDGVLAYPGAAIAHIGVLELGPLVERWPD
jgi:predicted deacylase